MKTPIIFIKVINGIPNLCTREIKPGDYIFADYRITPDEWTHIQKEGEYLSDEFGDHIELKVKDNSGYFVGNYCTEYAWKPGCYKIVSELTLLTP